VTKTGNRPREIWSPTVKKGRHRRFEEARRLKQTGPSAEDLGVARETKSKSQEDEYAAIAERYGVRFDENGDEIADDSDEDIS
jgi:hypothetical protein